MGYRFTGDFNERCICSVGYDIVYEVAEDAIDKAGIGGNDNLRGHTIIKLIAPIRDLRSLYLQ